MEIKTCQNDFPHSDNINKIIEATSIHELLQDVNYYYGGGFAVALMYAPRKEDNLLNICDKYYSDIDLFFRSKEDFEKAYQIFESLKTTNKLKKMSDTENAVTYEYYCHNSENIHVDIYTVQLIKKYIGTPIQILSTFDILNARILFSYQEKTWYFDKDYFNYQSAKKISLTESTPLLDSSSQEYPNSIFFQLERLSKYMQRYDLELDKKTLMKLIKIQRQIPDLTFDKNEKVIVRGYYSSYSKYVSKTFNVWMAFINIFKKNSNWDTVKNYLKDIDEESIRKMESSNENSMY